MPVLRCVAALTVGVWALVGCAQPSPQPRLEPTRTLAPRPTSPPAPTRTPPAVAVTALPVSLRYTPAFTLQAPLLQHLGPASGATLPLLAAGHFETRDANTLQLQRRIPLRISPQAEADLFWFAFSLDAHRGATMHTDGSMNIYDLVEGAIIRSVKLPEAPRRDGRSDLAFGADNNTVVIALNGALMRWSAADGALASLQRALPEDTQALRFSDDGSRVAAARANGDLVVLSTLPQPRSPITLSRALTTAGALELSFSPRGTRLAASDGQTITVWELGESSAKVLWRDATSRDAEQPARVSLTDAGNYALIARRNVAILLDLQAKRSVAAFQLSTQTNISAAALAQDGQMAFLLGSGEIAGFRVPEGELLARQALAPISRPVIAPNSRLWAAWSDLFPSSQVVLGELSEPASFRALTFRRIVRRVAFSSDVSWLAVSTLTGDVLAVRVSDGQLVSRLLSNGAAGYVGLCFAPNHTHLAYTDGDQVFIHDVVRNVLVRQFPVPQPFALRGNCANSKGYLGLVADGEAALSDLSGNIVWRARTGIPARNVQSWDLSDDAGTLAITAAGRVVFYDIARDARLREVALLEAEPFQTALDRDGRHFVASFGDRVQLVRVSDGRTRELDLPEAGATQISLLRDKPVMLAVTLLFKPGDTALRAAEGSVVGIWDLREGAPRFVYRTREAIVAAALSEDLETLALSSLQNTLFLLRRVR
ncbi:MAG: WD40 repeat domain-containing protein [Thermoflexales bacterium]